MTVPELDNDMFPIGRNPVWEKSWAGATLHVRIDDCALIDLLTCVMSELQRNDHTRVGHVY